MALLDTQVSVLANQALNYLVTGRSPRRMGNAHPNLVPYQVFRGRRRPADRRHRQRPAMLGFLPHHRPWRPRRRSPLSRERRPHPQPRRRSSPRSPRLWRRRRARSCSRSSKSAAVPAGPINTVAETFADPQVIARKMRLDVPATGVRGGRAPTVRSPIRMTARTSPPRRGAPRLGRTQRRGLDRTGPRRGQDRDAQGESDRRLRGKAPRSFSCGKSEFMLLLFFGSACYFAPDGSLANGGPR